MTSFPLVPAPAVCERVDSAPFALGVGGLVGDAAAVEEFAARVVARTGDAHARDGGPVRLRIAPGGPPESYRIDVDGTGVDAVGADAAGLFYAVQTLAQLIRHDGDGWVIPALHVEDAPRFAYRGLMLDVARHFFPVETVLRLIDRAAALKLNVLHLHLTDDQGWRLELRTRPALTARSAGSAVGGDPGGFYTREDYARIVAHAASRHVTVVPEIDTPGHTHVVVLAYPELVADPVITDEARRVAAERGEDLPAAGTPYTGMDVGFSSLRIGAPATDAFLADVFGELAGMTPGPYLHFGGDEALGTDAADYALFAGHVSRLIADLGKTPIAWHEAGSAELAPGTIGQFWGLTSPTPRAARDAGAFVAAGSRLILSPADAIYLDHKYDPGTRLGLTWANGPTSLHRSYAWEPVDVLPGLTDEDILGVEAALWTETVRTEADIAELAFPRIASAAEIAWSPRTGEERTWESFRRRVGGLRPLWRAEGIGFHPAPELDEAG